MPPIPFCLHYSIARFHVFISSYPLPVVTQSQLPSDLDSNFLASKCIVHTTERFLLSPIYFLIIQKSFKLDFRHLDQIISVLTCLDGWIPSLKAMIIFVVSYLNKTDSHSDLQAMVFHTLILPPKTGNWFFFNM